jgi:hypothetical protein
MRTVLVAGSLAALVGALGAMLPFGARADERKDLEPRLASVEKRLGDLERRLAPLLQAMHAGLPDLLEARRTANETAAQATLRNILSSQAQLQASSKIDEDHDGNGEYGGFLEMASAKPGRMPALLVPPLLSCAFRILDEHGAASRSGYFFRVYLPKQGGGCLGEPAEGFTSASGVSAEDAELAWCCYAWPVKRGDSGTRTFFVNQEGDILACTSERYDGAGKGPAADAAFKLSGECRGSPANGVRANDGNVWTMVN